MSPDLHDRGYDQLIDRYAANLSADIEGEARTDPATRTWLGWLVVWGLVAVVFMLPVLDRTRGRSIQKRLPIVVAGLVVLGLMIALAIGGVL